MLRIPGKYTGVRLGKGVHDTSSVPSPVLYMIFLYSQSIKLIVTFIYLGAFNFMGPGATVSHVPWLIRG